MLPDHATPASIARFAVVRRLADSCPPDLAEAIAVCGSTARGWSDDQSDIEMTLWAAALPPLDKRIAWLRTAGVTGLAAVSEPHWDGSRWITGTVDLDGTPTEIEIGWQTWADLDRAVSRLLTGALVERSFTFLGDLLLAAVPLRPSETLTALLDRLQGYPDAVRDGQIRAALKRFTPGHAAGLRRTAARGETLALNEQLTGDLEAGLTLLYAAHRRWMPSRKWTMSVARTFAPGEWLIRCDAALCVVDPLARIDAVESLVEDAIAAVHDHTDAAHARAALNG